MERGRLVIWAVAAMVLLALVAAVLGFIGLATGASSLGVGRAVIGRSVLTLIGLAMVTYLLVRRAPLSPLWVWVLVGAIALLLNPLTWTVTAAAGGALSGTWLTGSTIAGAVVDAVVWIGTVTAVAAGAIRNREDDDHAQHWSIPAR